jgi:hypothetical protein
MSSCFLRCCIGFHLIMMLGFIIVLASITFESPRCCKASRNPLLWDARRCVTHWHEVWKLVPGQYIGNRNELVSCHDTSGTNVVVYHLWSMCQCVYCVRVIFIPICPWVKLRQTCMVNPLVFTRIKFVVSTVNTVLGNLQEWCDLVSQDCDCHFSPYIFELKISMYLIL